MKLTDMEMAHSVELEILHDGRQTTLITSVEGMIDNSLLLTPIHLDGKIVGFPSKYTVNLLYPENGHVYCWNNVTIKAIRYRSRLYHSVELQGNAFITNRRGAYRVFIGEETNLLYRNRSEYKIFKVLLRDLSETGMCFMSKDPFEVGRPVHLHLRFRSGREFTLRSKILWKRENPARNTTYLYGCKFTEKNKLLNTYLMGVQIMR